MNYCNCGRYDCPMCRARFGAQEAHFGLFETDSDVRQYVIRLNAQIEGLNADFKAFLVRRWGQGGLPATAPTGYDAELSKDRQMLSSWTVFYDAWKAYKKDIEDTWFIVLSANKYREVEKWDIDTQAWRTRMLERGIYLSTPAMTTGGAIPGVTSPSNPEVADRESLASGLLWGAAKLGVVAGVIYLGVRFADQKLQERKVKQLTA